MKTTINTTETAYTDSREMELADLMREMISLGWTPESFDQDFDNFESDEVSPDEKELARKVFGYVWEDVQEEILDKAPDTVILHSSDLSNIRINNIISDWGSNLVSELRHAIVTYVNNKLPDYMVWSPETSEITGKLGQEITLEEFNEILEEAFDKLLV